MNRGQSRERRPAGPIQEGRKEYNCFTQREGAEAEDTEREEDNCMQKAKQACVSQPKRCREEEDAAVWNPLDSTQRQVHDGCR